MIQYSEMFGYIKQPINYHIKVLQQRNQTYFNKSCLEKRLCPISSARTFPPSAQTPSRSIMLSFFKSSGLVGFVVYIMQQKKNKFITSLRKVSEKHYDHIIKCIYTFNFFAL